MNELSDNYCLDHVQNPNRPHSAIHEETVRRQIRETNQELRELEMKLRAAYVGKSLKQQIAEKNLHRLEIEMKKKQEHQEQIKIQLADDNYYKEKKQTYRKDQLELRRTLQEQINDKQLEKQCLYKEFLREKQYLDEIAQKIHYEQFEESKEKTFKMKQFRCDIDEFIKTQTEWKKQMKSIMAQENQRIVTYLKMYDEKQEMYKQLKKQQYDEADALNDRMCAELHAKQQKERERENLLIELKMEEMKELDELQKRKELEEIFRKRIEIRLELDEQKYDRKLREERAKMEDEEFRTNQMKLLSERDRLEQSTVERKRIKLLEHRRAIQELLVERQQKREMEINKLIRSREFEVNEEKRMQKLIEEERIKLINEHAEQLFGHFPSRILQIK